MDYELWIRYSNPKYLVSSSSPCHYSLLSFISKKSSV